MKRLLALGVATGAALVYFFDPETGNRRRSTIRDRVLAFFRRTGRTARAAAVGAGGQVDLRAVPVGAAHHRPHPPLVVDRHERARRVVLAVERAGHGLERGAPIALSTRKARKYSWKSTSWRVIVPRSRPEVT